MSFAAPRPPGHDAGLLGPAAADEPATEPVAEPVPAVVAPAVAERQYVGLTTRVIAFALDAALINAVAILVTAAVSLFFSIMSLPKQLHTVAVAVGGVVYILWTVGYFVTFWSTTGQTPGNRVMHIRVAPRSEVDERLHPRRAVVRFAGLIVAALPLFAGYLLILVDNRRRGLQDIMARTVVIEVDPVEPGAGAPGAARRVRRSPARPRR